MKKENKILELFFEYPTKQWHFEEILRAVKISRPQATQWLQKLIQEKIIIRIKPAKKMPYYLAKYEDSFYQIKKRMFALEQLNQSGFFNYVASFPQITSAILFGSFSRWDWHKESDIDLFIYGNAKELDMSLFRKKLHREIQVFSCMDKQDLKKYTPALLRNIIEGYRIKGDINFVEVRPYV